MTLDEALATGPDPSDGGGVGTLSGWLPFCMVEVSTGTLWAGDPLVPEVGAGCVVALPTGLYRVEGRTVRLGGARVLARLRVCRQEFEEGLVGPRLGEFGTGSSLVAVGDLDAFTGAFGGDGDHLRATIERQLRPPCCLLVAPGIAATMPVLPSGFGAGSGPVFDLLDADGERVGFDLEFGPGAGP